MQAYLVMPLFKLFLGLGELGLQRSHFLRLHRAYVCLRALRGSLRPAFRRGGGQIAQPADMSA
jgi:hypothetical protein